jgi:hypothetical protein
MYRLHSFLLLDYKLAVLNYNINSTMSVWLNVCAVGKQAEYVILWTVIYLLFVFV